MNITLKHETLNYIHYEDVCCLLNIWSFSQMQEWFVQIVRS